MQTTERQTIGSQTAHSKESPMRCCALVLLSEAAKGKEETERAAQATKQHKKKSPANTNNTTHVRVL